MAATGLTLEGFALLADLFGSKMSKHIYILSENLFLLIHQDHPVPAQRRMEGQPDGIV